MVINSVSFTDSPARNVKIHLAGGPTSGVAELVISHDVRRAGSIVRLSGAPLVVSFPELAENIVARIREAVEQLMVHEIREGMRYGRSKGSGATL